MPQAFSTHSKGTLASWRMEGELEHSRQIKVFRGPRAAEEPQNI